MRRKGIFTILTAVFMVLAFSAVTFAAQTVVMKTSTPNIPKSVCYQVGTDTLEISADTVMEEGDVITITTSNGAPLCKTIDMFLAISGFTAGAIQPLDGVADTTAPVTATTGGGIALCDYITSSAVLLATEQWGFHIRGMSGSTVITLTLRLRDTAVGIGLGGTLRAVVPGVTMKFDTTTSTSVDPSADKLFVKLFDGKFAAALLATSAFYTPGAGSGPDEYDVQLTAATGLQFNILCLNTLNFTFADVENTCNSDPVNPPTKLSFSGDFRIAHILDSAFQEVDCKAKEAGYIPLGVPGTTQVGGVCPWFDNDDDFNGTGYCAFVAGVNPAHNRNYFIVERTASSWDLTNYQIKMDILVNGAGGDNGFYFTDDPVIADAEPNLAALLNAGLCNYTTPGGGTTLPAAAYGPAVSGPTPAARLAVAGCQVVAPARTTTLLTPVSNLGLVAGDKYLLLDIPAVQYDIDDIAAGDIVSVKITVMKPPCGSVYEGTIVIGTYGCLTAPPVLASCMTFPYFTPINDAAWWAGISLTNLAATDATATIKIYETDGDQGEVAVPLNSLRQYTALLSSLTFTQTAGTGTIGDSRSFVIVCVTGSGVVDGFGMLGDGLQGQGYLPRVGAGGTTNCAGLCP